MGWDTFAPRYTHVAASQTDSAVLSGATCRVYNVVMGSNGGAGTVLIEEYGSANVIMKVDILSGDTIVLGGNGFLADKGLQVTTTGGATCTVFHSNAGA